MYPPPLRSPYKPNDASRTSHCPSRSERRRRPGLSSGIKSHDTTGSWNTELFSGSRVSLVDDTTAEKDMHATWLKILVGLVELILENWENNTLETSRIIRSLALLFAKNHPAQAVIAAPRASSKEKLQRIHSILVIEQKISVNGASHAGYFYDFKELGTIIQTISKLFLTREKESFLPPLGSSTSLLDAPSFSVNSSCYGIPVISPKVSTSFLFPCASPKPRSPLATLQANIMTDPLTISKVNRKSSVSSSLWSPFTPPTSPPQTEIKVKPTNLPVTRIFKSSSPCWSVQWTDGHQSRNVSPSAMSNKRISLRETVFGGAKELMFKLRNRGKYRVILKENDP